MSAKSDTQAANKLDTVKLLFAVAIATAAVVLFYYYSESSLLVRVVSLLAAVGVAVAIALTTELGSSFMGFVQESRTELRKVVWPTRNETLQTSLIVILLVIVMAIFLWLLDKFLFWIVRSLVG